MPVDVTDLVDYTLLYWDQLPSYARSAAEALGYTQLIWDSGGTPPGMDVYWDELTAEQKEAAMLLGWDEMVWNGVESVGEIGEIGEFEEHEVAGGSAGVGGEGDAIIEDYPASDEGTAISAVDYYLLNWNQLPPEAVAAARTLGYTQRMWNNGVTPPESDLWWDDLSEEQRQAAAVLGYDEASWNGTEGGDNTVRRRSLQVTAEYDAVTATAEAAAAAAAQDRHFANLYIAAALCFIVVGLLDWSIERRLYPLLFVMAGLFGLLSAIYTIRGSLRYTLVFNSVSVHFFFLEAVALVWERLTGGGSNNFVSGAKYSKGLLVADVAFWFGSIIEVVLSYLYVYDEWAMYEVGVNASNAAAQSLWVICSLIYTWYTVDWLKRGCKYVEGEGRKTVEES